MLRKLTLLFMCTFLLDHATSSHPKSKHHHYTPINRLRRAQPEMSDCSYGICEHVPNYPENDIKEIIDKNKAVHSYFGNVIEPVNKSMSIFSRIYGEQPEPLCSTIDRKLAPKAMMDVSNVQRIIANVEDYHQFIEIQICDFSHGEMCFGNGPLDYNTQCVQKHHAIMLLTIDLDKSLLEYKKFRVPSTCVCEYKKKLP